MSGNLKGIKINFQLVPVGIPQEEMTAQQKMERGRGM